MTEVGEGIAKTIPKTRAPEASQPKTSHAVEVGRQILSNHLELITNGLEHNSLGRVPGQEWRPTLLTLRKEGAFIPSYSGSFFIPDKNHLQEAFERELTQRGFDLSHHARAPKASAEVEWARDETEHTPAYISQDDKIVKNVNYTNHPPSTVATMHSLISAYRGPEVTAESTTGEIDRLTGKPITSKKKKRLYIIKTVYEDPRTRYSGSEMVDEAGRHTVYRIYSLAPSIGPESIAPQPPLRIRAEGSSKSVSISSWRLVQPKRH